MRESKTKYLLRRLVADSTDGPGLLVACDPSRMGPNPTEDWTKNTSRVSGWCRGCQSFDLPFWYVYCRQ